MTVNRDRRYNTQEYRLRKALFIASVPPRCVWHRCPRPWVDVTLSGNDPWGPTIDHAIPISQGGDFWEGWQLMHRRCNLEKGDRPMPRVAAAVCKCGRPTYKDGHTHACW